MSRRIRRNDARAGIASLPRLTPLFLAGALACLPSGWAQESTDIVSLDIRDLRNKNARVRAEAAIDLSNIAAPGSPDSVREQTRKAIPALLEALNDVDKAVRSGAASALGNVPGDRQVAVPALIAALRDKDGSVRDQAASSLGRIGQNPGLAVTALAGSLKDPDSQVREDAMNALIEFGPAARTAVPDLIVLLKDHDAVLDWSAARVLGAIGPDAQAAVPALTSTLKATDTSVRLEAAAALANIGRNRLEAISIPTHLLDAEDDHIRARAAGVLGNFGAVVAPSVPTLTKALDDNSGDVRLVAANSLSKIAAALSEARRTNEIEPLRKAATVMELSPDRRVKERARIVTDAVAALQNMREHDVKWRILRPIREQPRVAYAMGGFLALALIWISLLWLSPISLLKIDEALAPVPRVRLPSWLGGMEISLSYLILVGFFRQTDRVLDAWVIKPSEAARACWESNESISKCAVPTPGPILFDREKLPGLSLEWPPKLRQPVKAQISFNGEESHESVSKKVHQRV